MGWVSEDFGSSHAGWAGAVLADGSEPGPVYLDPGSGSNFHETREWWAYSGILNRPHAAGARAACACGWRGGTTYPIDWDAVDRVSRYEPVIDGPEGDWDEHIEDVESRTVQLPAELATLLQRVEDHLLDLAADAPLAALRAVAALERATKRAARIAACNAKDDELSDEVIATALGLAADKAGSRLIHYALRH
ncbi:hypothetical protein [Streptomyces sp. NBC_00503]|uniref:hypothetical protein n=1 Tax=Streptomyces sp. NBC_00503 TaxID=2903659 RepID=UPI002E81BEC8|nr:hypothetical protein [Streptomyces sp. NBC_00503]WUD85354.1 hypothetical protein OG490_34975 [Streptomyces sp. NBC_00503]